MNGEQFQEFLQDVTEKMRIEVRLQGDEWVELHPSMIRAVLVPPGPRKERSAWDIPTVQWPVRQGGGR